MKKLLSFVLALLLGFGLAACAGGGTATPPRAPQRKPAATAPPLLPGGTAPPRGIAGTGENNAITNPGGGPERSPAGFLLFFKPP